MNQPTTHVSRESLPKVTARDLERLQGIIDSALDRDREVADALDTELARAIVVDAKAVSPDVVTMLSRVVYENVPTGESREITLVYPGKSNPSEGRVSVLAPLGAALIGLAVGDEIRWPTGDKELHLRVKAVPYQPEAAGEWNK